MHPYQNSTLGTTDRAADLLAQMTIEEKIAQLCAVIFPWGEANFPAKFNEAGALVKNETYTAQTTHGLGAICYMQFSLNIHESVRYYNTLQRDLIERTRLRIPMLGIDEGAHGHMAQQATSFPIPQGLGATFDPGLVRRVFDCTGREVRVRGGHMALTPVGDIGNDPRWGRVEETFGEETHLVTRMLVAAVQGLQGFSAHGSQVSPDHIAATAKHFAGFAQSAGGRQIAAADLPERLLRDQVLPPFRAAIREGRVTCIMPSYIEIDGLPAHANRKLLQDILRDEWGFDGLVASDFGGVIDLFKRYSVVGSRLEAARRALNAGVDMDLPEGACYLELSAEAAADPDLLAKINASVERVLTLKFALGVFDHPYVDEGAAIEVVHSSGHQQVALEAAEKSLVLLKNENNTLPLDIDQLKTIALIGPHSKMITMGGYSPHDDGVNIHDGLIAYVAGRADVRWAQGCALTTQDDKIPHVEQSADDLSSRVYTDLPVNMPNLLTLDAERPLISEAVALVQACDVAVLCIGESKISIGENYKPDLYGDRESLDLIGNQVELLRALKATGKPVVVVLIHGRALAIQPLLELADAVIDAWIPGEARGTAIARALFGEVNPGGKLPVTYPVSAGQFPLSKKITGYLQPYAFTKERACLPFGYGLSYTTFEIGTPRLAQPVVKVGDSVQLRVDVTNTGARAGDEVVQVYITDVVCSVSRQRAQLWAFRRVSLQPGESQTLVFDLAPECFTFTDEDYQPAIEPGEFEIGVGGDSAHLKTIILTLE